MFSNAIRIMLAVAVGILICLIVAGLLRSAPKTSVDYLLPMAEGKQVITVPVHVDVPPAPTKPAKAIIAQHPRAILWRADYCPACPAMESVVNELAAKKFPIGTCDYETHKAVAVSWGINLLPTLQVVCGDEEKGRFSGYRDEAATKQWLEGMGVTP